MTFLYIYNAVCLVFSFFAGAAIGSGIACLLMRSTKKESWSNGRSHCDSCGHVLGVKDLFPILSYIFSKGKCRYCGEKIPAICLLSEISFGLVGVAIVMWFIFPDTLILVKGITSVFALVLTIFSSYGCVSEMK